MISWLKFLWLHNLLWHHIVSIITSQYFMMLQQILTSLLLMTSESITVEYGIANMVYNITIVVCDITTVIHGILLYHHGSFWHQIDYVTVFVYDPIVDYIAIVCFCFHKSFITLKSVMTTWWFIKTSH